MAQDAAVAAIQFALETDEGLTFLRLWNRGDFDVIRREWPDAPEDVFIGADPQHPKTVIFDLVGDGQVQNALHKAAAVATQLSRSPRDLLGPATAEMKGRTALGERIAAAILTISSPQYEEGRAAYNSGNSSGQSPYERGSDDSRTWHLGFDFERAANMAT